ncbi:hypothetical protein [Flavobacteriaceae bacterium 14752]|uniref:hypothetical protein n=1 Tax=Mesohalobacter salilacus TaxID=2491711 RepID=UPI000F63188B|nr:hypothetical protein EIG84_05800 [Flavobacteriaceae bacterium 14752]
MKVIAVYEMLSTDNGYHKIEHFNSLEDCYTWLYQTFNYVEHFDTLTRVKNKKIFLDLFGMGSQRLRLTQLSMDGISEKITIIKIKEKKSKSNPALYLSWQFDPDPVFEGEKNPRVKAVVTNLKSGRRFIISHYPNEDKAKKLAPKKLQKMLKNPSTSFSKFLKPLL